MASIMMDDVTFSDAQAMDMIGWLAWAYGPVEIERDANLTSIVRAGGVIGIDKDLGRALYLVHRALQRREGEHQPLIGYSAREPCKLPGVTE